MDSDRRSDNRVTNLCSENSIQCKICIYSLCLSTFTFIASMILTVYLTHSASMGQVYVVLIVGSCLLYILGFISNMYSIYYRKPNNLFQRPPENVEISHRLSQILSALSQSSSTNVRPPDISGLSRAREFLRNTPPPPYDVPMSEISRTPMPRTSQTTGTSTQESEITEAAMNLIKRMYEEIIRTEQQDSQSPRYEQSMQQMVQTSTSPLSQQEMALPNVSDHNLVVQNLQTAVKSRFGSGLSPVSIRSNPVYQQRMAPDSHQTKNNLGRLRSGSDIGSISSAQLSPHISGRPNVEFRTNEVIQQKMTPISLPTQLDLGRLITSSEGCRATSEKLSPRISGQPTGNNFRLNKVLQQKVIPKCPQTQPGLERFLIGGDGCTVASSQLSPRRDFSKFARKRKLTDSLKELERRRQNKGKVLNMIRGNDVSQNNEYEEIEVRSIPRTNSDRVVNDSVDYYCNDSDFEDGFEQTSSFSSTASGPTENRRQLRSPSGQVLRKISALTTAKFCQLGKSPETYLDAVGSCFDLTPDEWMRAWDLSKEGVPPNERARILGLRLHEDSYADD